MWILAIHDKIYWLLNGRKYTVGRTSKSANSDIDFSVSGDSSVSRKHITLEVRNISDDAMLHPSIRSEVIVTDLNSRFGTKVDGKPLSAGASGSVPQNPSGMISIKLGSATKLRLRWEPFVVTYSTGQTGQAHNTLWQHAQNLLRPLDVKLMPYIVKSTNVFVKTGKSTSSLYFALTQQIPIANTHYFEALEAAAYEASKQGTTSASVLPDVSPFLPDPQWAPNLERTKCFIGLVFCIPIEEHAKALEPILTSAGAKCVDPNSNALSEDKIFIYLSVHGNSIPSGTKYTMDVSVFTALVECRSLNSDEIYLKGASPKIASIQEPPRKSRKTKMNVLDIMTSQDQNTTQGTNDQNPTPSGKMRQKATSLGPTPKENDNNNSRQHQRSRIMGIITSQDVTEQQEDNLRLERKRDGEPEEPEAPKPNIIQPSATTTTKGQKSNRAQKRTIEPHPKTPSSKKPAVDNEDDEFAASSNSEERNILTNEVENDLATLNYEALGELAIVEDSIDVNPRIPKNGRNYNSHPNLGETANKPNFKAFRRCNQPRVELTRSRKVDYDDQAPNVKFDYEDFDMFNDEKSNSSLIADISSDKSLAHLASRSKFNRAPENPEESLFVNSDVDNENDDESAFDSDTTPSSRDSVTQNQSYGKGNGSMGKKIQNNNTDDTDDFGFSFS